MKAAFYAIGVILFITAVGFFLFKNKPHTYGPMKVMNPTYFEDKGKIGRVISRRFYTHLKESKLLVLGSSPMITERQSIWYEMIKASLVDGVNITNFISIKGLNPLTKNDQIVEILPKLELGPGLTVIQVPSDDLWREKVMAAYPQADFVFFQAPYSLFEEQRKALGLECKDRQDKSLSCLAHKAGTRYYRKKLKENKLSAMMEQAGKNFYLLFIGEKF